MKGFLLWLIPALLMCSLAVLYFRAWESRHEPEPQASAAPEPDPEPPIRYPVEVERSRSSPLPPLDDSDDEIQTALFALLGHKMPKFIYLDDIVHRVVATVDNLTRDHLAARLLPVRNAAGLAVTEKVGPTLVLSPHNAGRYQAYIRLANAVPTAALVALYSRFYPLFQEQYENLGYPGRHFNDRAVEVIDHLLATPEPREPLRIIQPRVLYEFADPELEDLSAGQKILLRIGKANRDTLKPKLRELREAITNLGSAE